MKSSEASTRTSKSLTSRRIALASRQSVASRSQSTRKTFCIYSGKEHLGYSGCLVRLLEKVDLSKNEIGDSAAILLFNSMASLKKLTYLDLSGSAITDGASEHLVRFVDECFDLKELYLGFNYLNWTTGTKLFPALTSNVTLRVLDLSFNCLGRAAQNGSNQSCAKQICRFLEYNKVLVHLDLSSNFFCFQDTVEISKALQANHSIYGFHFQGNSGYVDPSQSLIPAKLSQNEYPIDFWDICISPKIRSVDKREDQKVILDDKIWSSKTFSDSCWICDG